MAMSCINYDEYLLNSLMIPQPISKSKEPYINILFIRNYRLDALIALQETRTKERFLHKPRRF